MRRTITMKDNNLYHRGNHIDYVMNSIRHFFKLKNSRVYKYVITIVEGTEYSFRGDRSYYILKIDDKFIGSLCIRHFNKFFFSPDPKKKYDITVKKVKIEK